MLHQLLTDSEVGFPISPYRAAHGKFRARKQAHSTGASRRYAPACVSQGDNEALIIGPYSAQLNALCPVNRCMFYCLKTLRLSIGCVASLLGRAARPCCSAVSGSESLAHELAR